LSNILNIRVTERELDLIMDLLHEAGDRVDADGQPAIEICHDLMEQSGRAAEDDGFSGPPVTDAALDMIQAGIDAREQAKASSMAADRRNERMMKGTASPVTRDFSNDPIDW
jgi:ketopantoate reductase